MTRVGVIGCGWAGDKLAAAFAASPATLTIVADTNLESAQDVARRYGVSETTTDYRRLLDTKLLDAVAIALPHRLHRQVGVEAAEAGLHVLVEKPIATSLEEADAMIDAARRAGVTLMVAENTRYDSTFQRAAEIVRRRELGDVFLIRISREHQMHDYLRRRPWFLTDDSGGVMYSGGIHDFELVRMFGGEVSSVYATQSPKALPEMTADDTSVALATLTDGVTAIVVESFSIRTPQPGVHGTVHGSRGSLWFYGNTLRLYREDEDGRPEQVETIKVAAQDTVAAEVNHFLDCIARGTEPITSGVDQRRPLLAVLAAYASKDRGARVDLAEYEASASRNR